MTKVKKADGSVEDFKTEKIITAITKAGGAQDLARQIAEEVANSFAQKDMVESKEIRNAVLARLKSRDKKTYNSWLAYDKQKGKQ
mgnify:CR=1 FL=1